MKPEGIKARTELARKHIDEALVFEKEGQNQGHQSGKMKNLLEVLKDVTDIGKWEPEHKEFYQTVKERLKQEGEFDQNQADKWLTRLNDNQKEAIIDELAKSSLPMFDLTIKEQISKGFDHL